MHRPYEFAAIMRHRLYGATETMTMTTTTATTATTTTTTEAPAAAAPVVITETAASRAAAMRLQAAGLVRRVADALAQFERNAPQVGVTFEGDMMSLPNGEGVPSVSALRCGLETVVLPEGAEWTEALESALRDSWKRDSHPLNCLTELPENVPLDLRFVFFRKTNKGKRVVLALPRLLTDAGVLKCVRNARKRADVKEREAQKKANRAQEIREGRRRLAESAAKAAETERRREEEAALRENPYACLRFTLEEGEEGTMVPLLSVLRYRNVRRTTEWVLDERGLPDIEHRDPLSGDSLGASGLRHSLVYTGEGEIERAGIRPISERTAELLIELRREGVIPPELCVLWRGDNWSVFMKKMFR